MIYELKNKLLCATISDFGAELISCKRQGVEFLWQGKEPYWSSHAPLLFPVCGRLLNGRYTYGGKEYEMSSHGFAKNMTFTVNEHSDERLVMRLEANDETRKIYPFNFELLAEFDIYGNEIFVSYTVANKGNTIMPYMLGWHPGFNLPGECNIDGFRLLTQNKEGIKWYPLQNGCFVRPYGEDYALNGNAYYLNEKEIYENDTMIFTGMGKYAMLFCPENTLFLRVRWSEESPYLCIWKTPDIKARFICIEPWSDIPSDGETPEDFETRKMSRLAPGESKKYQYSIKIG